MTRSVLGRVCLPFRRAVLRPCSRTASNTIFTSTKVRLDDSASTQTPPSRLPQTSSDMNSSVTPASMEEGSFTLPGFQADPDIVPAASSAASSAAHSLGPVLGSIQAGIEAIHTSTGLPWWATIVLTTVAVRTSMLPFSFIQARHAERLMKARPELATLRQHLLARLDEVMGQPPCQKPPSAVFHVSKPSIDS